MSAESTNTPAPCGAHFSVRQGKAETRFRILAPDATALSLCLFDPAGTERRLPMFEESDGAWTLTRTDCPPGTPYGFRADGPFAPRKGLWFNPAKLLLDPWARHIRGDLHWHPSLFDNYEARKPAQRNEADTAGHVPRSVVAEPDFDWQADKRLQIAWEDTVIYEMHVRGFTMQHPGVPESDRGKYLGLTAPAVLEYLTGLGITSVQLLPTAAFFSEHHLAARGLSNYWGYNPIALFAPHAAYADSDPVKEFKTMVRTLHAAGLEVILDIVLNHTAEADHHGPTLSMRGLDNRGFYRLAGTEGHYENFSGCGNSINTAHPRTLAFTLDCLRYWISEMHVDGFRFDLAASLGRDAGNHFNPNCEFFRQMSEDPILSTAKLIAEPWDVGPQGYQLGRFPQPWRECNGQYRDEIRNFWNHRGVNPGAFAERIAGSSDLFRHHGRPPTASVNFVTCHDGFTLRDLVSFSSKHNEANLEDNRDGSDNNLSANYGVEGVTEDAEILALRTRQQQNFLATLLLSQGVPHLLAGDERGHSQQGNNNAYCQDNPLSWLDWTGEPESVPLAGFVRHLLKIRKDCKGFRRNEYLTGEPDHGQAGISAIKDVSWLHPDGREMHPGDWHDPHLHCLGMLLAEQEPESPRDPRRYAHLVLFNASLEPVEFMLPECPAGSAWTRLFDTGSERPGLPFRSQTYRLSAHSCAGFAEPLN